METAAIHDSEHPESVPENPHAETSPFEFPCIRCGVCCSVYQVRLGPSEARIIADAMGMDYWDWVGRYCDPRWSDPRSHLIQHDDGGCVFLDHSGGGTSLCRIYGVRPVSCREWAAGIFKPACQEGLKRFWHIEVDASGALRGSPEDIARLREFLRRPQ